MYYPDDYLESLYLYLNTKYNEYNDKNKKNGIKDGLKFFRYQFDNGNHITSELIKKDYDYLLNLKTDCENLIKDIKNKGTFYIYLAYSDSYSNHDFFLTKKLAKDFIKSNFTKSSLDNFDGYKIYLERRKILILELPDYFSEKEIISVYGEDWKNKLINKE